MLLGRFFYWSPFGQESPRWTVWKTGNRFSFRCVWLQNKFEAFSLQMTASWFIGIYWTADRYLYPRCNCSKAFLKLTITFKKLKATECKIFLLIHGFGVFTTFSFFFRSHSKILLRGTQSLTKVKKILLGRIFVNLTKNRTGQREPKLWLRKSIIFTLKQPR